MPSLVPLIPITLDKPRSLRLDNRALLLAEREISRVWDRKANILQVLLDVQSLSLNDLCVLVWCGCLHEDPTLTLEQVQDAVSLPEYATLLKAVYDSWNEATAPAEVTEGLPSSPLAPASPGNGTGALPASSLASAMTSSGV
jgi:hypothetical protein